MQKTRLKDVAALAGVAINTASTILNRRPNSWASKETEERVFRAAAELGYKPNRAAQALRSGRFQTIALLVADLQNPYFTVFADAFGQQAESHGYNVWLETWRNDLLRERRILDELENRPVDGIAAFLSDLEPYRDYLAVLAKQGTPFVWLGTGGRDCLPVDSAVADFESGLAEAIHSLLQLGHRRFGFIAALATGQFSGTRPELFRRLLSARGIPDSAVTTVACEPGIADAYAAAGVLLNSPDRPTAIVALNDLSAIGVMRAAADARLAIPRDLSVVGVDGIPLGAFLPVALSTIEQPISDMARFAAGRLIERIESRASGPPLMRAFPTRFLQRESTGRAPKKIMQPRLHNDRRYGR